MHGKGFHRLPGVVGLSLSATIRLGALALLSVAGSAQAASDLIVSDISSAGTWTTNVGINGYRSYTFGAAFCNLGASPVAWQPAANHPAVAHGVFRLANGRFEQIGVSWVSHESSIESYDVCATCQSAGPLALGPGCGTATFPAYTSTWANLTSRADVNSSAGVFSALPDPNAWGPDALYRRIPIRETDIQGQPGGTMFFVEALAIDATDAAAGTAGNNASYRRFDFVQADLHVLFRSDTFEQRPAIYAWKDHGHGPNSPDPAVQISETTVMGEGGGTILVASKATPIAGGRWRYDYAVENLNCNRGIRSFSVPLGAAAGATSFYFHDVAYHSGDPFDGADWTPTALGMEVSWSTQSFATSANANALRWGTVYTFSFSSSTPPSTGEAVLGLFAPGGPGDSSDATLSVVMPSGVACPGDSNGDHRVDFSDLSWVLDAWGLIGNPGWRPGDVNRDGAVNMLDLNIVLSFFGSNC